MEPVNLKNKERLVKIVYYGPYRSGKTTNLEYIYNRYKHLIKMNTAMVKAVGGKILSFDFLPLNVGKIKGYDVKIQFYTIPGDVKYNATKRLVLKGTDGIVFVADSMAVRREKNVLSFKNLQENLAAHKKDIYKVPLVFQYNKRDLKQQDIPLLSVETLEKDLNNQLKAPFFEASSLTGENVIATMKKIILLTLSSLQEDLK